MIRRMGGFRGFPSPVVLVIGGCLIVAILIGQCRGEEESVRTYSEAITVSPRNTRTASPTRTLMPTTTPRPSRTQVPTVAPVAPPPTYTSLPTRTPRPTPTPTPQMGQRSRPIPFGESFALEVGSGKEVYLSFTQVLRWKKAWQKVKKASRTNGRPPEGMKYLLAFAEVEFNEGPSDEAMQLSRDDFQMVTNNQTLEPPAGVVDPKPRFDISILPGSRASGWMTWTVFEDGESPLLVIGMDENGSGGIYFELIPPAPPPSSTPPATDTPLLTATPKPTRTKTAPTRIPATPTRKQARATTEAEYLAWMDFLFRTAREITETVTDCREAGDQECLEEQAREYAVLLAAAADGPLPPARLETYHALSSQALLAYADAVEHYAKGNTEKGYLAALKTMQYNKEAIEERKRVTQSDG